MRVLKRMPLRVRAQLAVTLAAAGVLLGAAGASGQVVTLVKDILPGDESSFAMGFEVFNGNAYFNATDGVNGFELWKTDGTAAGTVRVTDLNPGSPNGFPTNITAVNGALYFTAFNSSPTTGQQVYRSDGTAAGTVLLSDTLPGVPAGGPFGPPAPGNFTALNGSTVLFTSISEAMGQELYATDGSPAGTRLVKDIHPGVQWSVPVGLTELNGVVYFAADDSVRDNGDGTGTFNRELWRTDGTEAGTYRVKDINPGPESSFASGLKRFGDGIYFSAVDETGSQHLYRTDGTEAGTNRLTSYAGGYVNDVIPTSNRLYFTADDGVHGLELWTSDGTTGGTRLVRDINLTEGFGGPGTTADASTFSWGELGGRLFFQADDGVHGSELWVTDGTEEGTSLFADLNVGELRSGPQDFTLVGDKLFFVSIVPDDETFTTVSQLWMIDGATMDLSLVFTEPGNSFGYAITDLTALGDRLLFMAPTGVDGDGFSINSELHAVVVPEPGSMGLLAGAGVLLARRRRR